MAYLDALNDVMIKRIMPGSIDSIGTSSPILDYLKGCQRKSETPWHYRQRMWEYRRVQPFDGRKCWRDFLQEWWIEG